MFLLQFFYSSVTGNTFMLPPLSLFYVHNVVAVVWTICYFLVLYGPEGSSSIFPGPVLECAIFPKVL